MELGNFPTLQRNDGILCDVWKTWKTCIDFQYVTPKEARLVAVDWPDGRIEVLTSPVEETMVWLTIYDPCTPEQVIAVGRMANCDADTLALVTARALRVAESMVRLRL